MAVQTEKWNVLLSAFDGLKTDRSSDSIPDGKSPDLLNVRIRGSHVIGSLGYELIGTRKSAAGEIVSKYTFKRLDGAERMLRVRDDLSNTIVEWWDATNEEWYILLPGLTTAKVMGFAEFNTSVINQCIFCNGVENMTVWTGSITRLSATVSGSPNVINVDSTADFPDSGNIIYNGIEVAYDSKTATTFVAAGGFHDSAGANDGVAQVADDSTHAGITKGNILYVALDRLLIAGQPGAPTALDGSDEGDAFTFSGGANRSDSFSEEFFNIGGKITGLSDKDGKIAILGPDGGEYLSFVFPTSTTKAPQFDRIFQSPGKGCTFQKSVFKINNEIYFTNKNGIVSISDIQGTEKVFTKSITRDILPTLSGYVFDEAASMYFDKESILLVACRTDSAFSANDIVLGIEFYQKIDRDGNSVDAIGLTKFDWPVNDFAILADELHFGSSLEQNSMKGFSTFQNDGAPRTIRYTTKRFNFKNPFQGKGAPYAGVRGFIKDGSDIDVKILYNSGFLGEMPKVIESDGAYVSQNVLNAIGAFAMGINPIGARFQEVSDLKQFLVYLNLGVDYVYNDIQLSFSSQTDGGQFLIDFVGLTVEPEGFAVLDNLTI